MEKQLAVIGAGSWGTTLANLLAEKWQNVTLWCYETDLSERMAVTKINDVYLPEVKLSDNLQVTGNLIDAVQNKDLILFVTPSQVTRLVLEQARDHISPHSLIVSASKGIENDSLMLLSQVFEELLPKKNASPTWFSFGPFVCQRGQCRDADCCCCRCP